MTSLAMNKNQLKMKYLMGLWKTLPNYPTTEDVLYELQIHLQKVDQTQSELGASDFKSLWGSGWAKSPQFDRVSELVSQGLLSQQGTLAKPKYKIVSTALDK
jgi:hypothetical protein